MEKRAQGLAMTHRVFFSYHHRLDGDRVSRIRDTGVVAANEPVPDADWAAITRGGDTAIRDWIDTQQSGRSCAVVLIGPATAGRKWIDYEIRKAWADGLGVMGIHIHNLKDRLGHQTAKGMNPFAGSTVVETYDPPYLSSPEVLAYIQDHIAGWVEKAIATRARDWTRVPARNDRPPRYSEQWGMSSVRDA